MPKGVRMDAREVYKEAYKDILFDYDINAAGRRMGDKFFGDGNSPFISVPCTICFTKVVFPLLATKGGNLGQCAHCGHIYSHYRLSKKNLTYLYEMFLPGFLINAKIRAEDEERRPLLNEFEMKLIESHLTTKDSLLDIGSCGGDLLVCARSRGWKNVVGQELSVASMDVLEMLGIPGIVGFTSDMNYEAGAFDAITMRHTLEHSPTPRRDLEVLRDAIADDGLIYIVVPKWGGPEWAVVDNHHDLPQHINHFTLDTLDILFDITGYEVLLLEEAESSRALIDDKHKGIYNNLRAVIKKKE